MCDDLFEADERRDATEKTSRCQCLIVMATYIVVGWMIMEERKDDGGCGRDVFFVAHTNNLSSVPSFQSHPSHTRQLTLHLGSLVCEVVGLGKGWRRATRRGDDPCQAHPCDSGFLVVGRPFGVFLVSSFRALVSFSFSRSFSHAREGIELVGWGFMQRLEEKKVNLFEGKKKCSLNWDEPL